MKYFNDVFLVITCKLGYYMYSVRLVTLIMGLFNSLGCQDAKQRLGSRQIYNLAYHRHPTVPNKGVGPPIDFIVSSPCQEQHQWHSVQLPSGTSQWEC